MSIFKFSRCGIILFEGGGRGECFALFDSSRMNRLIGTINVFRCKRDPFIDKCWD